MQELNREPHLMALDKTHEAGSEEWYCPTCGRRLMIQWRPSFNWMVLNVGDENAKHSGAKGEISVQINQLSVADRIENDAPQLSKDEEEQLKTWIDWMEENSFDNLWEKDDEE